MKARPVANFDFGSRLGEISHILALGPGRALVVSRYRRCVVLVDSKVAKEIDLGPLALTPRNGKAGLEWRGAPFRWAEGFAMAYADVLHLWPDPDGAPLNLPMTIAEADARRERGRLEPVLAWGVSERVALLALHAGAASVHAAHRIVRLEWNDTEARFTPGDRYVDLRSVAGFESSEDPTTAPHPPAIQAIRSANEGVWAHTTGSSTNHARYGMEVSGLALLDESGRVSRFARLDDGYASFSPEHIVLQRLRSKSGGIDFAVLDQEGRSIGDVRITKKAMAPLDPSWLVFAPGPGDLWLGDGEGRVARFEIA